MVFKPTLERPRESEDEVRRREGRGNRRHTEAETDRSSEVDRE